MPIETEETNEESEPWSIRLTPSLVITKAVWVPLLLLCYCFLTSEAFPRLAGLEKVLLNSNIFSYLNSLSKAAGMAFLLIWLCLSASPLTARLPVLLFGIWLLAAMQSSVFYTWFHVSYLMNYFLVYGLGLIIWRKLYGWEMKDQLGIASRKFGFTIRYILLITTLTAILLMLSKPYFRTTESIIPLGALLPDLMKTTFYSLTHTITHFPVLIISLLMLMDIKLLLIRTTSIIAIQLTIDLDFAISHLISAPSYSLNNFLLPSILGSVTQISGVILFGLALRWAGYRIVRQTDSAQPTEPLLAS